MSYNEVGRFFKISKSAVGKYVSLARVAGVDCSVADYLSDEATCINEAIESQHCGECVKAVLLP